MKKNTMKYIVISICCILLFNSTPFSINALSADLGASSFVSQMKTGWNLGNSLDSHYGEPTGDANLSQETIWGNPKVTKQQIDYVRSQGFDVIRVPVSWYTHTYRDSNGTIHISPEWMSRVREVVDYCIADGFYVIINTHHDGKIFHAGVSDADFNQVKADAASIWSEIATSFVSYDQHLIFEAYNEVDNLAKPWSFGKKAASQMNEMNQIFVNTVRSTGGNNSQRLLMVPTLLDKYGSKFQNSFTLPSDSASGKLIVTVHDYTKTFDQDIENVFSTISDFSKTIGAPVIIGEWGTTKKFSPATYRATHASNYIARAGKYGLKCIYWDNGSNYAIIDRKNLSANTDIISAIMNPREFVSDNTTKLSSWNNYLYMTIDQSTGQVKEDKHWGSAVITMDNNASIPLDTTKKVIDIGLYASDNMSDQRIHYIYFFDSNNKLLDFINDNNGFKEKAVDIPAGASYVRVGINNSYSKTKESEYKDAVEKGNLFIIIKYY